MKKKIQRKKIYFMIFSCSYVIFKVPCIEGQREGDKMMRYSSLLLSPKREEQHVPDSFLTKFSDAKQVYGDEDMDIMGGLEGFLGIEEEEEEEEDERKIIPGKSVGGAGHFNWDFMDWELEEEEEEEEELGEQNFKEEDHYGKVIKTENYGFWDGDHEKMMSLNLNLNYQDVLEAWSDRGSLWADECSLSITNSTSYMGEVPIMEEEKSRREASVMRYKEKRQTRLFSKKIRYQVRKLNADKRPRLKGRFVKRVPDQKMVTA